MSGPPAGTLTFLFTDIEGSTRRWDSDRAAMSVALARHDALLREAIEAAGGTVFKTVGDAFCAVFDSAGAGIAAALEAQRALAAEDWSACGEGFAPLKVRMALHAGEAETRGGYWFGPPLNRVARLLAVGHGGQVLLSGAIQAPFEDRFSDAVSRRDLGLRRLKDLRQPEHVFQLVAPDLPADFPPLATLDARPNNLPVQANSLVGRAAELMELARMLRATAGPRLVTLTGPGGTGKTRLALQAAADLIDDFDHGVWLVELASLADGDLVATTAVQALGVVVEGGRTPAEALALWARERRFLLVLDNCEQVIDGVAVLADGLLRVAPGLRILATSREPLAVPGEALQPVAPLGAPVAGDLAAATPETLASFDAVRLFVERAAAVRPGFAVTSANAPAVAQLCYRLDGIPLALELAAARVGSLAVEDIVARLDQRFRLLGGRGRAVLPRHQTLRACLDWSHDLLSEAERVLFRRLGVFAGSFSPAAAESVGARTGTAPPRGAGSSSAGSNAVGESDSDSGVVGDINAWDVLDIIDGLCARSLVVAEVDDGETRYRLLDTMRAYARERLDEGGDGSATRDRHLAWCLAMVMEQPSASGTPDAAALLRRTMRHHDDLLWALDWGLLAGGDVADPKRTRSAIDLALGCGECWGALNYRGGVRWLQRASEPARSLDDPALLATVLYRANAHKDLAQMAGTLVEAVQPPTDWSTGPLPETVDVSNLVQLGYAFLRGDERLPRLLRDLGLERIAGWILQDAGIAMMQGPGDLDSAELLFRRSLEIKQQARPVWHWDLAINHSALGEVERMRGHPEAALEAFDQGLELLGEADGFGWILLNRAQVQLALGRATEASVDLRRHVAWVRTGLLGLLVPDALNALPMLAAAAAALGNPRRAARLYGATVALWRQAGDDVRARRREGMSPMDWEAFAASESAARRLLSPADWDHAFAQGATLDVEAALAYAMQEADPWAGKQERDV